MTIAVVVNLAKQNAVSCFTELSRRLTRLGARLILSEKDRQTLQCADAAYLPVEELYQKSDMIIAVGGDGTILHTVTYAAPLGKPVLGINAGTLGFMSGLEQNELSQLSRLFTGDYTLDQRMMLSVRVNDEPTPYYVLNDAVISKGTISRILDMAVELQGRRIAEYRADGLIFSTPTGSTAYSLSSGGPVIDPAMNGLLVTPICPHSLINRSILFQEESVLSVMLLESSKDNAYLTVDGRLGRELSPADTVTIQKAEFSAPLIRIKPATFYETLTHKLTGRK